MKANHGHSIPLIDPNSRLLQLDPRKKVLLSKNSKSAQRSSVNKSLRKISRKANENDDYCQKEEMIYEKYHLIKEITSLKNEVANYNQQILKFIKDNKDEKYSSLSGGSYNSLSSLSTQISMLEDELSHASEERREANKGICAEVETKLKEEIKSQRNKINNIKASTKSLNEKLKAVEAELESEAVKKTLKIGNERRKKVCELTYKLNQLDEMENELTEKAEASVDVTYQISLMSVIDRLNKQYQHLTYERKMKEEEQKMVMQKYRIKNYPQQQHEEETTISKPSSSISIEEPQKNETQEQKDTTTAKKERPRVTFNIPPNLGIPIRYPPNYYMPQNYGYAYYDDQVYYECDCDYDYYDYEEEFYEYYPPPM